MGFQWSILFMLGSILTASGVLVLFVARAVRRAAAIEAAESADAAV